MRAEQELERSGNDGPEAVADSVPVRRASQGTDSSKALQGGGCGWSKGGRRAGEVHNETGDHVGPRGQV